MQQVVYMSMTEGSETPVIFSAILIRYAISFGISTLWDRLLVLYQFVCHCMLPHHSQWSNTPQPCQQQIWWCGLSYACHTIMVTAARPAHSPGGPSGSVWWCRSSQFWLRCPTQEVQDPVAAGGVQAQQFHLSYQMMWHHDCYPWCWDWLSSMVNNITKPKHCLGYTSLNGGGK